jgi:glycosyltransferase involved in cell wall biosynthesis
VKIVHIITRLILGGAQENTLITCKLLAQLGHDVTLMTGPALGPEGDLYEFAHNQKFKFIILNDLRRQINPHYDIPAYFQIKDVLRELKPQIVHTHSAKAGILGRYAADSVRRATSHERRVTKIVHGVHGLAFHPYQSGLLNKFYIAVEKAAAKRTDFFISVADAMTKQSLDAGIGSPEKYATAYSAIEEDDFLQPISDEDKNRFRQEYAIPEDSIVLVTIARLFSLKGHEFIIESAKTLAEQFPKVIWLFVGDGILADKYKKWIDGIGLGHRFRFTGLLPPQMMPTVLQSSDILVHCSLREGLARTLPQAMLCGKPAVCFDLDGAREVVNENTGRLIAPENVEQLTTACSELIQDKSLREKLGANGREFVREKFSPDTMVDTIEAVYRRLSG